MARSFSASDHSEDNHNLSGMARSSSAPLLGSSVPSGSLARSSSPPLAIRIVPPSEPQGAPCTRVTAEDGVSAQAGSGKESIVATLRSALLGGRALGEDLPLEGSPSQVAIGEELSGDESRDAVLAALRSVLMGDNEAMDQEAANDIMEALAAATASPAGEGAVRLQIPSRMRGVLARRLRALKARQAPPLTRMPQIDEVRALDLEVNVTFVIPDDLGSAFFKLALKGASSPEAIVPYGDDRTAMATLRWCRSSEVLKAMAQMPQPESEEQALTTAVAYVLWSPQSAEEDPASFREQVAEDPLAPLRAAESHYRSGICPPRRFLVAVHRGIGGAASCGAGDTAREETLRRVIAQGIRPLPSLAVEEGNPMEIGALALHLVELLAVGLRTWRAKTATAALDESCAETTTTESGSRLSSRPSSPEGSIRGRETGPGRPRTFDAVGAAAAAFDAATAAANGTVLAPRSLRVHDAACLQAAA